MKVVLPYALRIRVTTLDNYPTQSGSNMFVSVVIPTHNRRTHVLQAVQALMEQNYPRESYEVIVCCDRCTDGTAQALRARFGNQIEVIQSSVPGPSAAFNKSWRKARGTLVIGLDDDMEVVDDFIMAHVVAHCGKDKSKIVVTGYCPVVVDQDTSPIIRELAKSFEEYFERLERPARESTPLDICAGNFSIAISALHEIGGFDESYPFQRCDFKLAVRLLENGYELCFSRSARANHSITIDASALIGRAMERAQCDYRLAREHPWCLPYLQFYRPLYYPAARRRWRVMWAVCDIVAIILSAFRGVLPNNVRLYNFEYVIRYCLALKREIGCWREFCRLGELAKE
jgi:GT2 family glycosyltransferase